MLACTTSQAAGTTTSMRTVFLMLLLWAVASAHPVPGCEPDRPCHSAQQEATASEESIHKLSNLLGDANGRQTPASAKTGHNALDKDPTNKNAVDEELGEHGGQDKGDRAGETQHLNWMDHKDVNTHDGNDFNFLEEDARETDDDNGEYHGMGINGLPSHAGGFLDEEDDSGDDTFDRNGEEEQGEGPTYIAGANGVDEHTHDSGHGDAGAGGGHDDSSSSSSSESIGADHQRFRSYLGSRYEQAYRRRGGSSSSQEEEENYNFEDEAMQGDDPSVFNNLGSSYKGRHAGPRTLGTSWERDWEADSHHLGDDKSRSPEVEDTDSGEDSPSIEDNSESEDPVPSQSEENSTSRSGEDEEDSPSMESEGSKSRESTADWSDEDPGESPEDISPEVVNTSSERSGSQSQEGQEDQAFAKDSAQSAPDSKSEEDERDQSQSTEDTIEKSEEDDSDSNTDEDVLSTSTESQSASLEDDGSQEDNTGEDSSSRESNNSESPEDDDEESHSQENGTHESNSHGDDSSPQGLETRNHKWRPGKYHNKAVADYDDNDCQDGY